MVWEVTFEDRNRRQTENGAGDDRGVNVGKVERIASAVGGGALIGYAIKNRSKSGILLGVLGAVTLARCDWEP